MDKRVRDYLIKAHNKLIAHCRQALQESSLDQSDRERIQQRLADSEAELETIRAGASDSNPGKPP